MKIQLKKQSEKLVKPYSQSSSSPPSTTYVPLTAFDRVTYDVDFSIIFVYQAPAVSNEVIEEGLRRVLVDYREWAGRLTVDMKNQPAIILNDEGVRFVEATAEGCTLNQVMPLSPSPTLLSFHQSRQATRELLQVQLTRFACGGLAIGLTANHLVADGHATCLFWIAWGRATRGLEVHPRPLHDRTMFVARSPPRFDFQHRGVEYLASSKEVSKLAYDEIKIHKFHFTTEFLCKIKARASVGCANNKQYSTFESLVAHIWRAVTRARGLDGSETTSVRISVNGRAKLVPRVPSEYFGNLVLWAFPCAKVKDLLQETLQYATKLIRDSIAKVDDDYFKSFIDFAELKAREEGLVASAEMENMVLCPNLEVDSLLRFPFYDVDFGSGGPLLFTPTWLPYEGMLLLLPPYSGDGSVDVLVPLLDKDMAFFKEICYSLE